MINVQHITSHKSAPISHSFPGKLYRMLEEAKDSHFDHVISWQPEGRSFRIYKPEVFQDEIMPRYFAQSKFKSFQRQLNIYGWKKIHHGPNKGGYTHSQKLFIRGQPSLCENIKRRPNELNTMSPKGTNENTPFDPFAIFNDEAMLAPIKMPEKNSFLQKTEIHASPPMNKSSGFQTCDDALLHELHPGHCRINTFDVDFDLNFAGHEMDDFLQLLGQCQPEVDDSAQQSSDIKGTLKENDSFEGSDDELEGDHSFPFKLHLMLENAEKDNYSHIVGWVKGGTAFKVWNHKEFVAKVLPFYFDQSKYESFRRQLNLYGFNRTARGIDRGVISHPNFLRGERLRCKEIKRKAQPKGNRCRPAEEKQNLKNTALSMR